MGFLDNLKDGIKKVTDRVTGGYGKLELMLDKTEFAPGEEVTVNMALTITGEFKAKRTLLRLKGVESCEFEYPVEEKDESGNVRTRTERKTQTENTMLKEYDLQGELQLSLDGGPTRISQTITLPVDCKPTYMGIKCNHQWSIEAVIDIPWGADITALKQIVIR